MWLRHRIGLDLSPVQLGDLQPLVSQLMMIRLLPVHSTY
jgi:hypothetical protein